MHTRDGGSTRHATPILRKILLLSKLPPFTGACVFPTLFRLTSCLGKDSSEVRIHGSQLASTFIRLMSLLTGCKLNVSAQSLLAVESRSRSCYYKLRCWSIVFRRDGPGPSSLDLSRELAITFGVVTTASGNWTWPICVYSACHRFP